MAFRRSLRFFVHPERRSQKMIIAARKNRTSDQLTVSTLLDKQEQRRGSEGVRAHTSQNDDNYRQWEKPIIRPEDVA